MLLSAYLVLRSEWLVNRIVAALTGRLEGAGINLSVGQVDGSLLTGITLSAIEMTLAGKDKPILSARTFSFRYSPFLLATRRQLASLSVRGVRLLLEKENGTWNYSDLFTKAESYPEQVEQVEERGLSVALPFSVRHITVQDGAVHIQGERDIKLSKVNLFGSVATDSGGTVVKLHNGRFVVNDRLKVVQLSGATILQESGLALRHLVLRTENSRLALTGRMDSVSVDMSLQDSKIDIKEFTDILIPELELSGRAAISGTFNASPGSMTARARMLVYGAKFRGKDLGWLDLSVDTDGSEYKLELNKWQVGKGAARGQLKVGTTTKTPVFAFNCRMDTFEIGSLLNMEIELTGDLKLNGTGSSLQNAGARGRLRLSQGTIEGVDFKNMLSNFSYSSGTVRLDTFQVTVGPGRIISSGALTGQVVELDTEVEGIDVATFSTLLGTQKLKGTLSAYMWFSGPVDNPSLSGTAWITKAEFGGIGFEHLGTNVNIQDVVKEPKGFATVNFVGAALGGPRLERGAVELTAQENKLEYELWARAEQGSLAARGKALLKQEGFEAELEKFSLMLRGQVIENTSPIRAAYSDSGITISPASIWLFGTEMHLAPLTISDEYAQIGLAADSLSLKDLSPALGSKLDANGFLSFDFKAEGRLDDPSMSLLLDLRDVSAGQASMDSAVVSLSYAKNLLEVEGFFVYRNGKKSTLSGHFPINLTFRNEGPRIPDSPVSLDADFNDVGTWIFIPLKNMIGVSEGRIDADIKVRGTTRNPDISGTMDVFSPEVIFRPTLTRVSDVVGRLKLKGERLDLVSISGKTGTGEVEVKGYLTFQGLSYKDYRVNVKARNARVEGFRDVSAAVNTDIVVKRGKEMLNVEGDIEVIECLLTVPFRKKGEIPLAAVKHNVSYDLEIHADRNVWLKNRDADIEMGTDVRVRWKPGSMVLSGVMDIVGGTFEYLEFTQPFKVKKGEFRFSNAPELNPSIDIEAEAQLEDTLVITLTVTGTMLEPHFRLSSKRLSETQILLLLGLGSTGLSIAEGGERATSVLLNRIIRQLERTTPLHEIRIKTELFGQEKPRSAKLYVGRYVRPDLFVSYSHDLFADVKDEYRVEYYLWKGSSIVGSRDDQGRYNLGLGFKIRY